MNAKTHTNICKGMIAVTIIGGVFILCKLGRIMTETELQSLCSSLVFFIALWFMFLSFAPVRCNKPGCNGRMRRNWVEEPDYHQYRLQYLCDKCGDVYDSNITFGLGEPGQY